MANGTRLFGHLATAMAGRAHHRLLDLPKHSVHDTGNLAAAITLFTGDQLVARLGSRTMAVRTLVIHRQADIFFGTKYGLFKTKGDICFDIAPPLRASLGSITAKELAKNIAKATTKIKAHMGPTGTGKVAKIKPLKRARATAWATHTGMAKLIITLAFLLVFQYLIGFVNLFKLGFIATLFIWVVAHG